MLKSRLSSGTTEIELQGRSFRVIQLVGFKEAAYACRLEKLTFYQPPMRPSALFPAQQGE